MVEFARRFFTEINNSAPGFRWIVLVVILSAEALGISVYFDPWLLLENNPDWSAWIVAN